MKAYIPARVQMVECGFPDVLTVSFEEADYHVFRDACDFDDLLN